MEKKLPKAQFGTILKNTFKGAVSGGKTAYKAAKAAKLADEASAALKAKRAAAAKKASETRAANKAAKEQAAANAAKPKATKATTETKPATKAKRATAAKTSSGNAKIGKSYPSPNAPKSSTVKSKTTPKKVKDAAVKTKKLTPYDNSEKWTGAQKATVAALIAAPTAGVIAAAKAKSKKKLPSGADVLKTQGKYKFAKGGAAKRK